MDYANLEKIPASLKNVEDVSNLLNEKIVKINNNIDEKADANIIAITLNDLNDKINTNERVTSSSLNDLNDKVDDLNDKIDNNESVIASALTDLDEKIDTNERVVSAALNDLDDKIGYEIKTTNNITNPTKNTYYDLTSTPVTNLTIPSINSPYEIVIKFTTDSTNACTIAIPNNQKYIGDLNVDKGITYIISIFNGIIVIAETKTNSQTE